MIKFCHFRRRNAIKIQIMIHPIKAARTAAFIGCFLLFRERTGHPAGRPRRMTPAGCRGSRNKMLSPRKGTLWPLHGLGTDFRHLQTNIIFFMYIPQFLPRGLRAFFYSTRFYFIPRHITKEYMIFITGVPGIFQVRFFCALMRPPYRVRAPPLRS